MWFDDEGTTEAYRGRLSLTVVLLWLLTDATRATRPQRSMQRRYYRSGLRRYGSSSVDMWLSLPKCMAIPWRRFGMG